MQAHRADVGLRRIRSALAVALVQQLDLLEFFKSFGECRLGIAALGLELVSGTLEVLAAGGRALA